MAMPVLFHNWSNEDFTHSWDSVPFTFPKGEKTYLESWKADHFGKHFVDREMMKDKLQVDDQRRVDYLKKTLIGSEESKEVEAVKLETELINLNINAKKKPGRPKKAAEEEHFEGLAEKA